MTSLPLLKLKPQWCWGLVFLVVGTSLFGQGAVVSVKDSDVHEVSMRFPSRASNLGPFHEVLAGSRRSAVFEDLFDSRGLLAGGISKCQWTATTLSRERSTVPGYSF